MRRLATLIAVVGVFAVLPACGDRDEFRDEVLRAVRRTSSLSRRFEYIDRRSADSATGARAQQIAVRGLVEDDFRYKARVAYDGTDAFDEVVSDDLLAVRFIEPREAAVIVDRGKVPDVDLDTDVEGLSVVQALETRRWVLDPSGAPSRTAGAPATRDLGKDPALDAITAMSYVERAVREAQAVERWSPDDLSPAYTSSEDDFPEPEEGSGVTRYDLHRPPLPAPGNFEGRSETQVPTTRHFRRMAIYVEDGRVIQVRETIDLRGKFLEDFFTYLRTFMRESEAPEEQIAELDAVREEFAELESETERDAAGLEMLQGFSLGVQSLGVEPILIRTMTLDLRDVGEDIEVDLPVTETVQGRLAFLRITDAGKATSERGTETGPVDSPAADSG